VADPTIEDAEWALEALGTGLRKVVYHVSQLGLVAHEDDGVLVHRLTPTGPKLPLPDGYTGQVTVVFFPAQPITWAQFRGIEAAMRRWGLSGRPGLPWEPCPEGCQALALSLSVASPSGCEAEGWWHWDGPRLARVTVPAGGLLAEAAVDELPKLVRVWRRLMRFVKGGRPVGSGTFASREECLAALRDAAQALRRQGKRPTQGNVAELLRERGLIAAAEPLETLLYWLRHYGIGWRDAVS
jgi:hypothetical protein